MSELADRTIKELRAELDELAGRVRGCTDDDLARPSGAAEWDVSQVLSHLGSGAEIGLANLEGALGGTPMPADFMQQTWARWDAMSRAERAAGFVTANENLVRRLESLDDRQRDDLRIKTWFPEPVDVATLAGGRLSEFAHHFWDIEVAFEETATLRQEAVELLVDQGAVLIGFIGRPDGLGGRQATVAVRLTSPERSFGLDVRDKVALVDAPAEPDAVLSAPAEWWLRLVSGRHAPEHTPAGVTTTGAVGVDDLRRVFPGF